MSLAHSEDRVSIPGDTNLRELAGAIASELESNESVRGVALEDTEQGYLISASTTKSLFSWGEEIRIQITKGEVLVESKSPDQWIDWGKSEQNVDTVSTLIEKVSNQNRMNLA